MFIATTTPPLPPSTAPRHGQAGDGAISFSPRTNKVYDTKPKLKIKGAEFSQLSPEDLLSLEFDPPMAASGDRHFEPSVQSDDTILLELASGKR